MKLHLNLSLRRALLTAMAAVATFASTATAGVMHDDVAIQTYTDYAQNVGRYAQGTKVNALLSHIREQEGGITINYTDGTTYTISASQGIVDSSGVHDNGALNAISPNFLATVKHNGPNDASFGERIVGSEHAINYSTIHISGSSVFQLVPVQSNGDTYDYALQRQSKIITDANWIPVTGIEDLSTLQGQYFYHIGSGTKNMWNSETNTAPEISPAYVYMTGGINTIGSVQIHPNSSHLSIHQNFEYNKGVGASEVHPLPNILRAGDSGSPIFIYNSTTGQYEYLAAQQSYGDQYGQARGDVPWTQKTLESYNVQVDAWNLSEVHLFAASTQGEYHADQSGNAAYEYLGKVTDAQGRQIAQYKGVQIGLNTWADLSGLKDKQNWYAYDSNAYIERTDPELFFTQNLVFTGDGGQKNVVLQENVDLGVGYAEFNNGSFTITSREDESFMFNHAGYVINAGAEVHLRLVNPEKYMTEWRKTGAGDLYIDGTGDTNALLNLGGSGKTYLQQKDGYAAYNVLVNNGASVVIQDTSQIKRDFTFGSGGGTLDMNGNSMEWYETTGGDNRFTINALTEQALITNTADKVSTLTYKEGGDRTYLGSFADTEQGALRIDYQGDGTWQLHSIHTDLTNHEDSGLTVTNGRVILSGTNTVHGKGSANGSSAARLELDNDWHYADASMAVQVMSGGTFELGSHARLTGDVTVEDGGTFVMRERVQNIEEYVEGGIYMEDTGKYEAFHGLKGDVILADDATMHVQFNKGTTADNTYSGSIIGTGTVKVDSGYDGGRFILAGDNTGHTGAKQVIGGGLIFANEQALGDTSVQKWRVDSGAYIASDLFVEGYNTLKHIDGTSTGVLALSSNYNTALDLQNHSSLVIGALEGTTVQYGQVGTNEALDAVDGAWRFGGGGGELQVNYLLTGNYDLYIGASSASLGTVTLANPNNDFSGNIIIQGYNVKLNASETLLSNATYLFFYGHAYDPEKEFFNRIGDSSTGILLVDKIADTDIKLDNYSGISIGASEDSTYTGTLSLGTSSEYRFSAINNATLTVAQRLESDVDVLVDAQGHSGGTVALNLDATHQGNITVQGHRNSAKGGDVALRIDKDVTTTGTVALRNGGSLDVDGHKWTISGDLSTEHGSAIKDTSGTGTVEFTAASGTMTPNAAISVGTLSKTGAGTLNLTNEVNVNQISVTGGTLAFATDSLTVNGNINASNGTHLHFKKSGSSCTSYKVGSITNGTFSLTVDENVQVTTGTIFQDNSFGTSAFLVNGGLDVNGEFNLRYQQSDKEIKGSGVINVSGNALFQMYNNNSAKVDVSINEFNVGGALNLNTWGSSYTVNIIDGCTTVNGVLNHMGTGAGYGNISFNISGGDVVLNGGTTMSYGQTNLNSGKLIHTGGESVISNNFTMSGGEFNLTGGYLKMASAAQVTGGSINVSGGALALSENGTAFIQGAATTTISGDGVLDLSKLSFTSSGGLSIGTGGLVFDGGGIAFGKLDENKWYQIFSGTNPEGWNKQNLTGSQIYVNGKSLQDYGHHTYSLDNGGFSYDIYTLNLVWNSASSDNHWNSSAENWMISGSQTASSFANGDDVIFNSDANLELDGDIIVNNLTIAENVNLSTHGSLSLTGNLTAGRGSSWEFSGDTTLKLTGAQLSSGASFKVGEGASLVIEGMPGTLTNSKSSLMDNVSGVGTVVFNYGVSGNGAGFDFRNFSGTVQLEKGRIQVNASQFGEACPSIVLKSSESQLVFANGTQTLGSDIVLEADTTFHANTGCGGILSGVISGSGNLTKAGTGTLTFTVQNTYTGTTTFAAAQNGSGRIILATGGEYVLNNSVSGNGTLEVARGTTLVINKDREISSALDVNGGVVDVTCGDNRNLACNLTVRNGGTLTFSRSMGGSAWDGFIIDSTARTITLDGGTLDLGAMRHTLQNWSITMSNGALIAGEGSSWTGSNGVQAALDVASNNMQINAAAGASEISASTRLRTNTLKYNVSDGASLTVSGLIMTDQSGDNVGIVKEGTGVLTFTRDHTFAGKTTISAGKLVLDLGTVTTGEGENAVTSNGVYSLDGTVTGAGTLEVAKGTTLVVANGKAVSSALLVNGGVVDVTANNNAVISGNVTVQNGGEMKFSYTGSEAYDCFANPGSRTITLNNGTLDFGATRQTLSSWGITMSNGSLISGEGQKYSSYQAAIDINAASMTFAATAGQNEISAWTRLRNSDTKAIYNVSNGATLTVSGLIQSDGMATGGIEKQGDGTLIFTRDHSFNGTTTISGGTLVLDLGTVTTGEGESTVTSNGVYTLDGAVTGAGTLQVNTGTTLQVDAATETVETAVSLQKDARWQIQNTGAYSLSKGVSGEGTLEIAGGATVTSGTGVKSLGSSITVDAGGTLKFTGGDVLDYGVNRTLTVNGDGSEADAGVIDFGSTRQTMGGWTIELNGGTITGEGGSYRINNIDHKGAIDFNKAMNYVNALSGDSTISATTRIRGATNSSGARIGRADVTYYVNDAASLNVSGLVHTDGLGSGIVKTGEGALYLNNGKNDLDKIVVQGGMANIHGAAAYTLDELHAATKVDVGFYAGATKNTSTAASVSVSEKMLLGGGASLNISCLTLEADATLDMDNLNAGAVTLNGALTFGGKVQMGAELLATVGSMSGYQSLVIFTGLTGADPLVSMPADAEGLVQASEVFSNVQNNSLYVSYQVIDNVGSLMVIHVPEPATTTLSLLALSALAMRRRRK